MVDAFSLLLHLSKSPIHKSDVHQRHLNPIHGRHFLIVPVMAAILNCLRPPSMKLSLVYSTVIMTTSSLSMSIGRRRLFSQIIMSNNELILSMHLRLLMTSSTTGGPMAALVSPTASWQLD